MSALLEMEGVSLGYGGQPVLEGVDLRVDAGELVVIAGGSGCGKSTLLRAAIGLLPPLAGRVRLLGHDLATLDDAALVVVRSRVGLLFQSGALLNALTVAENVALPVEQHTRLPRGAVDKLVRMKLAAVGLEEDRFKAPSELSGGMRKRVALARAMALDPDLLFCDEPTAGLDPVTAASLDRLLLDLRATLGITLLVVTHDLPSIETIADRLVMLADGGVIFDGTMAEAQASPLPALSEFLDRRADRVEAPGRSLLERLSEEAEALP